MQVAVLTSEGRVLLWEVEFYQVGINRRDSAEEEDALPSMLTAHPVGRVGLVSVGEEEEGGVEVGEAEQSKGISLADTIAPHWFLPPEGENDIILARSLQSHFFRFLVCVWLALHQVYPWELVGGASFHPHVSQNVPTPDHKELVVLCSSGCHWYLKWVSAGV